MKCHYEILGLSPDCSSEDLKKAYRKLALEWHPDKNLHRLTEATEIFQLIQQAYEILSDPQERAWYDRHKDDILKGDAEEAYKDNTLNVYQYFNTSCFKGYNDGEKGFYTVYCQVFETIATEDKPFLDEKDFEVPSFGSSDSSYEEVVHNFYAYWQSYCTVKSYSWVDKFDLVEARKTGAGRPVIRAMEKENKKLREQHRKIRNEEVRELVAFVRKRDKRVQAQKKIEEERKIEKARKAEELRKQQVLERNKSLENYQESEWASRSLLEEKFDELENHIDDTFGADSSYSDEDFDFNEELYCVACEKDFRSEQAMKNHKNSKKHKENVASLKLLMQEEDEENSLDVNDSLNKDVASPDCDNLESSEILLDNLIKSSTKAKRKKKKEKKAKCIDVENNLSASEVACETDKILEERIETLNIDDSSKINIDDESMTTINEIKEKKGVEKVTGKNNTSKKKMKAVSKGNFANSSPFENESEEAEKPTTICETCNVNFKSRNKLFDHLKESGHASYKNVLTQNKIQHLTKNSERKKINVNF